MIVDYQLDMAKAAIEAGADAIFCCHAHILKGIEFIQGKPVFYNLCNFPPEFHISMIARLEIGAGGVEGGFTAALDWARCRIQGPSAEVTCEAELNAVCKTEGDR